MPFTVIVSRMKKAEMTQATAAIAAARRMPGDRPQIEIAKHDMIDVQPEEGGETDSEGNHAQQRSAGGCRA